MNIKVFEINKSGQDPLSIEIEQTIQNWLEDNLNIRIISTTQSQHLRENTVFVSIFYEK